MFPWSSKEGKSSSKEWPQTLSGQLGECKMSSVQWRRQSKHFVYAIPFRLDWRKNSCKCDHPKYRCVHCIRYTVYVYIIAIYLFTSLLTYWLIELLNYLSRNPSLSDKREPCGRAGLRWCNQGTGTRGAYRPCLAMRSQNHTSQRQDKNIVYEIPIDRHERHNISHLQIHTNELYLHCLWPNPLKHSSKQKR